MVQPLSDPPTCHLFGRADDHPDDWGHCHFWLSIIAAWTMMRIICNHLAHKVRVVVELRVVEVVELDPQHVQHVLPEPKRLEVWVD